ncbi:hypothetical protein OEA41_003274 [Lepraria neglecta]|uniref:Uncharacterized protein n=1 Tax=Lepraria neglecta TaxID=209136 RepID=A0AAE0DJ64_9LECA|nr:hypothetical protein OEA41_003274 [Lepraria neglecta]
MPRRRDAVRNARDSLITQAFFAGPVPDPSPCKTCTHKCFHTRLSGTNPLGGDPYAAMSGAVSAALSNLDPAERKMVENYTEKELKQAIKMSECELISKALFDTAKELNENIKLW